MGNALALAEQIMSLAVQFGPVLASDVSLVMGLLRSGNDPTPEQQVAIDAALDRINQAVQDAVAKDAGG